MRAKRLPLPALIAALIATAACEPTPEAIIGGTVGATVVGAHSPSHEIEQIYYLGVFDPQEQIPPMVYRVRVHGQASFISATHFASGWVPAQIIDSLGSSIKFDKSGQLNVSSGAADTLSSIRTGRRLVVFGPEGFREAPRDHRLVIVMGSTPEDFFNAINESLGTVSSVIEEQRATALTRELFEALTQVKNERDRLTGLERDFDTDLMRTRPSQMSEAGS